VLGYQWSPLIPYLTQLGSYGGDLADHFDSSTDSAVFALIGRGLSGICQVLDRSQYLGTGGIIQLGIVQRGLTELKESLAEGLLSHANDGGDVTVDVLYCLPLAGYQLAYRPGEPVRDV
jgi:hypothetical protein